jgi:VWFA-related protein
VTGQVRRTLFVIAATVTAAAGLPLAGAGPAQTTQQAPQFRGGTDIVPVDFLAYGPNGMPVTNLTAKDIRLVVDGKAREIKTFQFVRLSFTSVETPTAAPMLPLPFASNEGERPGRSVVIVIDHEQIRAADSKAAIDAAKAFVDRLTPIDRAAVVTLPNGKVEVDLTTNKERVKAALGTVVGHAVRRTGIGNVSLNEALNVLADVNDPDKVFTKELQDRECKFRA